MPAEKMKKLGISANDKKVYNKICGGTEQKPSFEKLELTRCSYVAIFKKQCEISLSLCVCLHM